MSSLMSVPLLDRVTAIPRDRASPMSSNTSGRMSGSPPDKSSAGDPNSAMSRMNAMPSSVVSSGYRWEVLSE